MSMISRYKRPGGFVQLLSLIETSTAAKKEKFLEIVRSESESWANAIEQRVLTMDRIFTWPDNVVTEVFKNLPLRNMACALQGFDAEKQERILQYMSHSERRKIQDEMGAMKSSPEEFNGTILKLLEITRKMISDGQIRVEKIDESMMIPEDFEDKLEKQSPGAFGGGSSSKSAPSSQGHQTAEKVQEAIHQVQNTAASGSAEVLQLQRMAQALTKENKSLKDENRILREKLEQIRKIA
ncbi:MAG: hypothetical protein CL676_11465 [Bdellovibrionaceae bacterium]|nr:hypothetical protein [Pseudobdellovibrionaceae bacterium]|tara:strand:+ start:1142 stop:1858 length:717 start_codon:yes stop_codon:yes gene_type:complete